MKTIGKVIIVSSIAGISMMAFADDGMSPTNQGPMALTPQQFVQNAMVGGMKEVRLGEIALERTQNADVKKFAKRMVNDHSKANEKLMMIAYGEGLSIPATNTFSADDPNWSYPLISNPNGLKGAEMLTLTNLPYLEDYQAVQHLQALSGDQFDRTFAAVMVDDHTNAINEFYAAAQNLPDEKLKAFADKTLPTLRKHYVMAEEMAGMLGAMMNTNSADTNPGPAAPMGGSGL